MNQEMVPLEIIGLKADLPRFVETLRELGCVHIDTVSDSPDVLVRPLTLNAEDLRRQEDLGVLSARTEGLIEVLHCYHGKGTHLCEASIFSDLEQVRLLLEELFPRVQQLTRQREELENELASLPLYETTLRKLLPLMPSAAYDQGKTVVGVLVNRANVAVLDLVSKQVLELTHGIAEVISSDVDESTRAMLIVLPKKFKDEVENLLGQRDVARLRLPRELGEGLPDVILETIHRRMNSIPVERKQIENHLAALAIEWCPKLTNMRTFLRDELDGYQVLSRFGETDMTFVLVGWAPKKSIAHIHQSLREAVGEPLLVQELPSGPEMEKRAPIIMENPMPSRPFESLVRLLELPAYNHIDPTTLMSLFLPIFFGLMLGDIGYGAIILVISLVLLRKFRTGFGHDLMLVIAIGSGWAIAFGILFGELFGNLGEHLGLHPIWMARDSQENVLGLLLMTIAIGAGHVTLGLILGVWQAVRDRSRAHLLERGGMLVGLIGLFLLVGALTEKLPPGFMTPAVAGIILGIVLLSASLGWIGILMGPIEFIGLIGNVLSYLRIAAIGLASVYLAKVANEMAGIVGNMIVGLVIAILIHALNLLLGAFSPTIHSLRLHYVEFFRKFYEGGGKTYEPFRSRLS